MCCTVILLLTPMKIYETPTKKLVCTARRLYSCWYFSLSSFDCTPPLDKTNGSPVLRINEIRATGPTANWRDVPNKL